MRGDVAVEYHPVSGRRDDLAIDDEQGAERMIAARPRRHSQIQHTRHHCVVTVNHV